MALWGGRFSEMVDDLMARYSSSLDVDQRLWQVDIEGSIAHVRMLGAQAILSTEDADLIVNGLTEMAEEIQAGRWSFDPAAEDVHGEIERRLIEKIGDAGKRMHTARSRNDQVATATRLYLRTEIERLRTSIRELQKTLVKLAEEHLHTVLPGMTHFQHAQPVSLAHHLMAYFWMLHRDQERLTQSLPRVLALPLGSAALAGTGFPIDRKQTAKDLGFISVAANSLDAVSDRDFVIEFLANGSLLAMHLTRLCEELILWSTPEFAFVELSDKVTTGSSIMPQKKNPDGAELIRGRSGRVYGALMGALTMMKSLPLAYNRDMQEDKVHLFTAIDTLEPSVRLMNLMLASAHWNRERMAQSLTGDFSNATDLADDLATKGMSFREAHEVVGALVRHCSNSGLKLEELSLEQLQSHHKMFDENSLAKLSHVHVMAARTSEGGTAVEAVREQILQAKKTLD